MRRPRYQPSEVGRNVPGRPERGPFLASALGDTFQPEREQHGDESGDRRQQDREPVPQRRGVDKHKDSRTVSANLHGINLGGPFQYDYPEREPTVRIEMVEGVKFEDGALLGIIHTGAPINMEGKMLLRPAMQVRLTHKDTVLDVMALLPQLRAETRRYLDILMRGLAEPEGGEGDWAPIEVTHPED